MGLCPPFVGGVWDSISMGSRTKVKWVWWKEQSEGFH